MAISPGRMGTCRASTASFSACLIFLCRFACSARTAKYNLQCSSFNASRRRVSTGGVDTTMPVCSSSKRACRSCKKKVPLNICEYCGWRSSCTVPRRVCKSSLADSNSPRRRCFHFSLATLWETWCSIHLELSFSQASSTVTAVTFQPPHLYEPSPTLSMSAWGSDEGCSEAFTGLGFIASGSSRGSGSCNHPVVQASTARVQK